MDDRPDHHPDWQEPPEGSDAMGWFLLAILFGLVCYLAGWRLIDYFDPHAGLGTWLGYGVFGPFVLGILGTILFYFFEWVQEAWPGYRYRYRPFQGRRAFAVLFGTLGGSIVALITKLNGA